MKSEEFMMRRAIRKEMMEVFRMFKNTLDRTL